MGSMGISGALSSLRLNRDFMSQVVAWERLATRPALFEPLPGIVDSRILAALEARGVDRFYRHQAAAVTAAQNSEHVVVATATASGKSLCYTVPVLQRLLAQPSARALYLFPTKALAHDQLAEHEGHQMAAADSSVFWFVARRGDTQQH